MFECSPCLHRKSNLHKFEATLKLLKLINGGSQDKKRGSSNLPKVINVPPCLLWVLDRGGARRGLRGYSSPVRACQPPSEGEK